jgi:hypothetical protein
MLKKIKKRINLNKFREEKINVIFYTKLSKIWINPIQYSGKLIRAFLFLISLYFLTDFVLFNNVCLIYNDENVVELSKIFTLFLKNNFNIFVDFFNSIISNFNSLQNENTIVILENSRELKPSLENFQNTLQYKPIENSSNSVECAYSSETTKMTAVSREEEKEILKDQIEKLSKEVDALEKERRRFIFQTIIMTYSLTAISFFVATIILNPVHRNWCWWF